ncbi:hypothetical protein ACA910_005892 [Epithemia clementina (nom. ined.)]
MYSEKFISVKRHQRSSSGLPSSRGIRLVYVFVSTGLAAAIYLCVGSVNDSVLANNLRIPIDHEAFQPESRIAQSLWLQEEGNANVAVVAREPNIQANSVSLGSSQRMAAVEGEDTLRVHDWVTLSDEELSAHVSKVAASGNQVQKDQVSDIEFYWQMPEPNLRRDSNHPVAVLFVAHECRRSAQDWFSSITLRAPEEQAIVQLARQRGMMVVAMSALNQGNQCWDRLDAPRIVQVLQHLQSRRVQISSSFSSREHIPLFAFGSSTGAMVISSHLQKAFENYSSANGGQSTLDGIIVENVGARLNPGIPSVYITQAGEEKEHRDLDNALKEDSSGLVLHVELPRKHVTPIFLFERIQDLTEETSLLFYEWMVELELLDAKEGQLQENPMYSPKMDKVFAMAFEDLGGTVDNEDELRSAIVGALMVSWGKHVTVRDGVSTGLDFLLGAVE